jgi:hypothetical protein
MWIFSTCLFLTWCPAALVNRDLVSKQQQLSEAREKLARLQGDISAVRGQYRSARNEQDAQAIITGQLSSAKQSLTEEMRRLLGAGYQRSSSRSAIGGIPVDSEYIIFIIDTSGSIGKWIPDTPARRKAFIKRLAGWEPFSNSSPVEGIEAAIRRFHAKDKRISLYVFGDDFARGSIQTVINTVDQLNRADRSGRTRVRIHAVGFPVLFDFTGGLPGNAVRYAALMRKLAENNNGSFVGLNSLKR